MTEYTASVGTGKGTQAVTVRANTPEAARAKLFRLGYLVIYWMI